MSNSNDSSQGSVEQLLDSLRNNYLAEFNERCDELEHFALVMPKAEKYDSAFANMYREVHTIKGTSGTHGLMALSSICHHFEDLLTLIDNSGGSQCNNKMFDIAMLYIDLLRDTSWSLQTGDFDQEMLNRELEYLRESLFTAEYKVLVADASRFNQRLCKEALEGLPVTLTVVENGFDALQRLLSDDFDLFITSKELPTLNGIAVLSALRASESKNAHIEAILMTSNENLSLPNSALVKHVVKKDRSMSERLHEVSNKILEK